MHLRTNSRSTTVHSMTEQVHYEQTAEPICEMMAALNLPAEKADLDGHRSVNDPCCGSGRMLLAAADIQPNWHFVGQDVRSEFC